MHFRLEALDQAALTLLGDCAKSLQRFGETELIDKTSKATSNKAIFSPDGYLTITGPSAITSRYFCEAKNRVDANALAPITERLHERESALKMKPLLLTSHVNDALGERLREAGIAYLDAAGNAYLVADPFVYIWLRGFKPSKQPERVTRAFQTAGLQLIALLLGRPNAVERPYRELASQAGLSLGSASRILSDLRSLGFIRLIAPGRNSLVNRPSLLERWQFGYATRLRPRLLLQTYRQTDNKPVEELPTRIPKAMKDDVLVGGELAAALATRHLRPQTATFHLRPQLPLLPMLKEMRLVPDPNGNVVFLEQFSAMAAWRWEKYANERLVSPLLVYAELLHGTPDDRLRETAKLIFDEYLAPILNDELSTDQR